MEKKKMKKLVLNQETISTLSKGGMSELNGGGGLTEGCPIFQSISCTCDRCETRGCDNGGTGDTQCGTCIGYGSGLLPCCDYTI